MKPARDRHDPIWADLDDTRNENRDPIKRLWHAVILVAVTDARSADPTLRDAVQRWISTPDFALVCGNADMDPGTLRRQIRKVLQQAKPRTERQAERIRRHNNVHTLRQQGLTMVQIAEQLELTKSNVAKILRTGGMYQHVDNITN